MHESNTSRYESVVPSVQAGRRVLVAAHNNVIRCIAKHIDQIPAEKLRDLEIPTGAPLVYVLDRETLQPIGTRVYVCLSVLLRSAPYLTALYLLNISTYAYDNLFPSHPQICWA